MIRFRSFSRIVFSSVMGVAVLVSLAGSGFWAFDKYAAFQKEADELRAAFVEASKDEVRYEVERAVTFLEHQIAGAENSIRRMLRARVDEAVNLAQAFVDRYGREMPAEDLQRLVVETLRALRFNEGRGYYFATRLDGVELLFADRPDLEGKNLLEMRSTDGKYVVKDMIALVREQGEGFYEYLWTEPGSEGMNHRKVSFIRYFEPFDCFIGAGEYIMKQMLPLQKEALDLLARVRFGQSGYLFGSTLQGDPLFTNGAITKGGPSILDLTDPNGVRIIKSQIDTINRQGSGYVEYAWRKLEGEEPSPKIAYVMGVPEWGWIIGSGFYVDEVENEINARRQQLQADLRSGLGNAALLFLTLVLLSMLAAKLLSRGIGRQLDALTGFLSRAATDHVRMDPERLPLLEFKAVAASANRMLDTQEETETALRRSEEKYRRIVDTALEGIWLLDENQRTVLVNPHMARMLGYGPEEMLGRLVEEFMFEEDLPDHRQRMGLRIRGISDQYERRFRRRDGNELWTMISATAIIDEEGRFTGSFGMLTDITERLKYEKLLERAREEAESANRSKSEFLANMSHEIRTPLNAIVGMLQLMRNTPLNGEQARYVDMAIQSGNRLARLMGDILDLSRIEAGKMEVMQESFDLHDIFVSVSQLFALPARQKGLELSITVDDNVPPALWGDAGRLQQICNNLVGNAVKFTEKGGVSLEARALPVAAKGRCRILVTVTDTGIGMSDEQLHELFAPFTQAADGYRREHQGAGLGLSIVKRLVELMDGSITVESSQGGGTIFYISIPFETAGVKVKPLPMVVKAASIAGDRCRILLAEDDSMGQVILTTLLRKAGCHVDVVGDGSKAVEVLKEGDYDLVLMDVQLPVMDGVEAMQAIRNGAAGADKADTPVVAITAYAMSGDKERFMALGMSGYLPKPIEMEELLGVIESVLAQRRQQV